MPQALRIGIDARLAARGLGIATYIGELARELVDLQEVRSVLWLGSPETAPRDPRIEATAARRIGRSELRNRIDVVHFAANTGWIRPGPVASVLTVHDLIFRENRGRTLRQQLGRRWMGAVVPRAARAADEVITVSDEVADELVAAGYPSPTVIPHGIRSVASAPGPAEPYFVAFAGADPRKNVSLALAAYARARQALNDPPRLLLLAGAGLSGGDAERARRIPGVEVRPYLPSEEVAQVLRHARALIHPSTREGFGLPVLEGFAAGTPVIGGLTSVGLRIGGQALIRIDPADPVSSLTAQLIRLSRDPGTAHQAALAGLARAREFSWRRCAECHVEVYTAAVASRR